MSDFRELVRTLEAHLGDIHQAMTPEEWEAFKGRLAEAIPALEQATTGSPEQVARALIKARYQLQHACNEFSAARGVLPAPGGLITDPGANLGDSHIFQHNISVEEISKWARIALELCSNPDGIAGRQIPGTGGGPQEHEQQAE